MIITPVPNILVKARGRVSAMDVRLTARVPENANRGSHARSQAL